MTDNNDDANIDNADDIGRDNRTSTDANRDPLSGAPGAHPVGTATGAVAGAATGAAVGTMVGGQVGMAVGGVAGAVAGGLGGKGIAEAINPTEEDAYWRANYSSRPYVNKDTKYETLQPAYRYGWESRAQNPGRKWEEVESDLSNGWDQARGNARLAWSDAKDATRDAWDRIRDEDDSMDMTNEDGSMRSGQDNWSNDKSSSRNF
jgi:hypothetical protein